jgi:imidazolonepropionase-like amidohydrolase
MKVFHVSRQCIFIFGALLIATSVSAQEDPKAKQMPPVSRTYAITNATIIQAPGRTVTNANLVLKEGIIVSVGKGTAIPADAIIIKGDSLFIYPGFIDGLSHAAVSKPKDEQSKERPKDPGNPAAEAAGISPQNDVRNFINPADKSVDELRALGFTTAQVVPYGGMLPGYGAIIFLNGASADNMVVVGKSVLYSQLTGAQRVYPSTIIGVMAKWRELYRQSIQSKNYEVLYAANRTGLSRPASDRILEAFYPVIDKRIPVLFEADKMLKLNRILKLQQDLGFSMMIGDVKEGWEALTILKSANTKVFLSLDLPEEKKTTGLVETPIKPVEIKSPEAEALEKRKMEFLLRHLGQAAAFQKEGVKFGFSSLSVKSKDIRSNLRRMIANGLTEDQALAALTIDAAGLLGLSDRIGSIDRGKIANLVLTDKPYFNEKSNVRYVFVEGTLHEYKPGEPKPTETGVNASLVGTWTVTTESAEGKKEEKVTIKLDGVNLSGSVTGNELPEAASLDRITLSGNNLTYSYTVSAGGQSFTVDVQATVEGNTFSGTATRGNLGVFKLEAVKDPNQ